MTLGGTASLLSTAGGISFASTIDGSNALTVNGNAGVTFGGAIGSSTALSSLSVTGATALNTNSVTTTGAQTYNSAVTLSADTAFTSKTSGAIGFIGTLDSSGTNDNVTVTTTNGNVSFTGAVGSNLALASLKVTAPNSANTVTFGSTLTLNGTGDTSIISGSNILLGDNWLNSSAGNVYLRADYNGTGTGAVTVAATKNITTSGIVSIFYNPGTFGTQDTIYSGGNQGTSLFKYMLIDSLGTATDVGQRTLGDLSYNNNGAGTLWANGNNYALAKNIDATATGGWNNGAGFSPIGNSTTPFNGSFHGLGNTISNLYINQPSNSNVGFFGSVAVTSGSSVNIQALNLVNVNITGSSNVGGLAGSLASNLIGSSGCFTNPTTCFPEC